jgi:hypothetical protein
MFQNVKHSRPVGRRAGRGGGGRRDRVNRQPNPHLIPPAYQPIYPNRTRLCQAHKAHSAGTRKPAGYGFDKCSQASRERFPPHWKRAPRGRDDNRAHSAASLLVGQRCRLPPPRLRSAPLAPPFFSGHHPRFSLGNPLIPRWPVATSRRRSA